MEKDIISCKNPMQHGDKWLLMIISEKTETLPCFACCTLKLEDKQELNLRKRMILSYMRDLMGSNAQVLIETVSSNVLVVFHTVNVFLDLLKCNDERVVKLTGKCLLLFLIHMKKEEFGLAVLQRLTVEIEGECNYALSLPHLNILGQLFEIFPKLVELGEWTKTKFLNMLAKGLSYPSDEVKDVILSVLRQIYCNMEKNKTTSRTLDTVFLKRFLRILKSSQNNHLIKNTLDLLQIFLSKVIKTFNVLFEISSDDINFADVIKKIILSNEEESQICIVQCICQLLNNSLFENHISYLLEANVPEILFEALSTKNEKLLESILRCLVLFVYKTEDTLKSHFTFGTGMLSDVCCSLLDLKRWKLLCTALNLLTSIISSNEYLRISSHITFYYQFLQLTEKTFKVQNSHVLYAVCHFFTEFLKNKDLPCALPLEQIYNNVNLCLKSQLKFISSLAISEHVKHLRPSKPLTVEMKLFICILDMIHSCIKLCNRYRSDPVSVENGFTCPTLSVANESSSHNEKFSRAIIVLCLSSIDEIFIPCSLQLKSSDFGIIAWYHLVQVLAVIYEEIQDVFVYQLAMKLIKARFLKYLFDMKISKTSFNEYTAVQIEEASNRCVKSLLTCILKPENHSDAYLKALDIGVNELNDSLEECANVLSQKYDTENRENEELWASSRQITFLCICYISFRSEAFIVNIKALIPHLICFVTCNSDLLSSSVIILKHLIFLMAVCTYECINRNMKYQTELMEANVIIWDLLSRLKSPLQVYTHHKYVLWWCFKNQASNIFNSDVLRTWLLFSVDKKQNLRQYAMKIIIYLLCFSYSAQQTFVLLFDLCSSSNNEAIFQFLKEAYEVEVSCEEYKKKFQNVIVLMIHHLHSFLTKLFIMKSENDKSADEFLCQGLTCLLWCHKQINGIEIDAKILFHISKYCFFANSEMMDTTRACIKFLQFTLTCENHFKKVWHVITGDHNLSTFFYKCFTYHSELEVEALYLLICLFNCQVNNNLKCNIKIKIPLKQILKWLNSSNTQILAYKLLNLFILSEEQEKSVFIVPVENEEISFQHQQFPYYRLFSLSLQNAIVLDNPIFLDEAIYSYLMFLNIINKTNKDLENHIMLQPWVKFLMESRLQKLNTATWKLLDRWLSFDKVNPCLIEVVQQFSSKLQTINPLTEAARSCIIKLNTGTYANFIAKEQRNALRILGKEQTESNTQTDLVTQVQDVVTNCLYNIS